MTIGLRADASGTFGVVDVGGVSALTFGAEGLRTGVKQIQTISTSVAANALTVGLGPTSLDFRDTSATSGAVNTRTAAAPLSLVVPSGATLGTANNQSARLAVLAIDNAGTIELAITNLAGGVNLDETTLISTTALSGASNSASVIYSTTARTAVAFRVVGFIDITETTAGAWTADATRKQGAGGLATAGLNSVGYGQAWQDVTASRAFGTTYYNTTGRPLRIRVSGIGTVAGAGSWMNLTVNGASIGYLAGSSSLGAYGGETIIPIGGNYSVTVTNASLSKWVEA